MPIATFRIKGLKKNFPLFLKPGISIPGTVPDKATLPAAAQKNLTGKRWLPWLKTTILLSLTLESIHGMSTRPCLTHGSRHLKHTYAKVPLVLEKSALILQTPLSNRQHQEEILLKQLDLANQLGLPVSIHIRRAWDKFIKILKQLGPLPHGGLIHSYSGSCDMVPVFEGCNLFISFSGSITNPGNKKVARALKATSFDRVLIETDSPDIMPRLPVPCLDKINTPNNLMVIAEAAAKILNRPTRDIVCQTFKNAVRLFAPIIKKV